MASEEAIASLRSEGWAGFGLVTDAVVASVFACQLEEMLVLIFENLAPQGGEERERGWLATSEISP